MNLVKEYDMYKTLRCPIDMGMLDLSHLQYNQIITGKLICEDCGKSYPVTSGAPDFLANLCNHESTAKSFGYEWKLSVKHNAEDENLLFGVPCNEALEAFLNSTQFSENEITGKKVLDAGCGNGNLASQLAKLGAEVYAIDIHDYLPGIAERHSDTGNLVFSKADIFKLPFAEESFDMVYSFGVLHHTPDPAGAFGRLTRLVKKGGKLLVYVYYSEVSRTNPFRVSKKIYDFLGLNCLGHRELLFLCYFLSLPMYVFHGLYRIFRPLLLTTPEGWAEYGRGRKMLFRSMVMKWFDALSPRYASTHKRSEVIGWFRKNGFTNIYSPEGIGNYIICGTKNAGSNGSF